MLAMEGGGCNLRKSAFEERVCDAGQRMTQAGRQHQFLLWIKDDE